MKRSHMRPAFSMVTAVFVIVIMAAIGMLITNISGKTVKATTIQYQRAQAELYAKSYTEFAVMAVTAHDRSANCVDSINGSVGNPTNGSGYKLEAYLSYIGDATTIATCARKLGVSTYDQTPLTVIVDVYVRYKDPDNPTGPWHNIHRRSVQKI